MTQELVCINCPLGCRLRVEIENGSVKEVSGHACPRGEAYAKQEAVEPMRILTALMRVEGQEAPISVKTAAPVPKRLLFDCAKAVYAHPAALPVRIGDVLISNVCNTGVDIIATQDAG